MAIEPSGQQWDDFLASHGMDKDEQRHRSANAEYDALQHNMRNIHPDLIEKPHGRTPEATYRSMGYTTSWDGGDAIRTRHEDSFDEMTSSGHHGGMDTRDFIDTHKDHIRMHKEAEASDEEE
jgi:hypothetical protein